jgi:hypothetical protein
MTDSIALNSLNDRKHILLRKAADLDEQKQIVNLQAKHGRITADQANVETAKIAGEHAITVAVLTSLETIITELTATLPVQIAVADVADLVTLFTAAFAQKTVPAGAANALDRLRTLARLPSQQHDERKPT